MSLEVRQGVNAVAAEPIASGSNGAVSKSLFLKTLGRASGEVRALWAKFEGALKEVRGTSGDTLRDEDIWGFDRSAADLFLCSVLTVSALLAVGAVIVPAFAFSLVCCSVTVLTIGLAAMDFFWQI